MKKLRKLKKKRDYPAETERDRATGRRPAKAGGKPGPKPGGKLAQNDDAKRHRDKYNDEKKNGKAPAGKEKGHGKGGVRKTSKVKNQSIKSNRAEGGRKGNKAGKARGGRKSKRS